MKYISGSKELNDKVLEFLQESEKKHPAMDFLCDLFGKFLPKMKQLDEKIDELLKEEDPIPPDLITLHFQDSFITFSRW